MSSKRSMHIEDIMRPVSQNDENAIRSLNEHERQLTFTNDGMSTARTLSVPISSLPPGVQQGLLIPPPNRRVSDSDVIRTQRTRSNLSVLLESQTNAAIRTRVENTNDSQSSEAKESEADSASGPSKPSPPEIGSIARSAPTEDENTRSTSKPPPSRLPSSFSPSNLLNRKIGLGQVPISSNVRRCISSKDLGTLGPPSGSPLPRVQYQRQELEAALQKRLIEARRASLTRGKLQEALMQNETVGSPKVAIHHQLKNETRNRRRAEHNQAVTNDLCEIVTDLFIAEAKLLKPSSYGFETSFQRDHVMRNVMQFVSALPPRYALGVDTPSEVLLHMRLMAAARMDHSRAVVHVTNTKGGAQGADYNPSVHLVTISCVDALGLLEYITGILATGGSRVLDADVMLSTDNIVLDRFLVEMKGRLRLDKVAQSIEHFLADSNRRTNQKEDVEEGHSSSKSLSSSSFSLHGKTSGPLYFQVPLQHQETSAKELSEEIESAVPLSEVLIASSSSANLVPLRRNIHRCNTLPSSFLNQTTLTPDSSVKKGYLGLSLGQDEMFPQEPESVERKRRPLVSREATNFPDSPEQQRMQAPPLEILMIPPRKISSQSSCSIEDRVVPLIPFEELMLIETLGMGRVSTIYRAAWQKNRVDTESTMLRDVTMVALKVATINPHTGESLHVDELRREANIATMLKHPNVCELVGVAADAECFCLAYEYCEGGSLLSLLSSNSRYYEYLPLALDIANGMAYLHSRQVIHRDLKPSNVLLTRDRRAKISDFGMSVANQGQELTAETGTYRYMAPEVIRHESYSSNADVYSFGILLWQLITREVPFSTMTPIQAAFAVAQGRRPEIPTSTPIRLQEIISTCWDQDAHMRPSFTYIAMALADYARHAFSPANVGAQTLQIANEMLATVEGNSTINVDFTTVNQDFEWSHMNTSMASEYSLGLEIE